MKGAAWRVPAFVLLCAIWGSTWLVIKIGYGGLGPLNVAAIRFLLAGLVMVPLVPIFGATWPKRPQEWGLAAFVGIFLFAIHYGLIYWGELRLDSGMTAVIFAVNPLMTALMAHAYLPGERATPRKLGGTLVAFVGVATLFAGSLRLDPSLALPILAIVVAAFFGAVGIVTTKKHAGGLHPAALNAPAMLIGGVALLAASYATGESPGLPSDAGTWGAIAYLALAGSVVTFLVYFWLLRAWTATTMSMIAVIVPLVALALGYLALGERPTLWTALGGALILGGVTLALTSRRVGLPSRVSRAS